MRPQRYFVIYSQSETENTNAASFWSNKDGWTGLTDATVFTQEERSSFDLPVSHHGDAEWVLLPPCMMVDPRWVKEDG